MQRAPQPQASTSITGSYEQTLDIRSCTTQTGINAGLAVSLKHGLLVVSNSQLHTVTAFTMDTKFHASKCEMVFTVGTLGNGKGRFNKPGKMCFGGADDSKLYVVDTGNHRVQVLRRDGAFLNAITPQPSRQVDALDVAGDVMVLAMSGPVKEASKAAGADKVAATGNAVGATATLTHDVDAHSAAIALYRDDGATGTLLKSFDTAGRLGTECFGLRFTQSREHILVLHTTPDSETCCIVTMLRATDGSFVRAIGKTPLQHIFAPGDIAITPSGDCVLCFTKFVTEAEAARADPPGTPRAPSSTASTSSSSLCSRPNTPGSAAKAKKPKSRPDDLRAYDKNKMTCMCVYTPEPEGLYVRSAYFQKACPAAGDTHTKPRPYNISALAFAGRRMLVLSADSPCILVLT